MAGRIVHPEQSRPSRAAFSWLSVVRYTQHNVPGQAHESVRQGRATRHEGVVSRSHSG
jgi:hypothetical protein